MQNSWENCLIKRARLLGMPASPAMRPCSFHELGENAFGSLRIPRASPAHPPLIPRASPAHPRPQGGALAPPRGPGESRRSPAHPVTALVNSTGILQVRDIWLLWNWCSNITAQLRVLLSLGTKGRFAFKLVTQIRTQREKDYMGKELPKEYLGSTDKFGEQTSINTGHCNGKTHFSYHWNSFSSFVNAKAFAARNKGAACSTFVGFLIYITTAPRLKPLSTWKWRRSNPSPAHCSEWDQVLSLPCSQLSCS